MIVEFILSIFFGLIFLILGLFALPGMPTAVLSAVDKLVPYMTLPVAIIKEFIGVEFLITMINLIIILITFFILLRPGMWLYNKIRGSGGGGN